MMLRTLELQLVLALGGTAAFVALWLTLRRAAACEWLFFWVSRAVGIALSTVVFAERTEVASLVISVALILAASQVLLLRAVWRHIAPHAGWLIWRRIVWVLLVAYLIAPWLGPHGPVDTDGNGGALGLLFRLAALPTNVLVLALLIARWRTLDVWGVRLMVAGVALQVVQNTVGALITIGQMIGGTTVTMPEGLVWLPIVTYVALVLGSLYLVLAESRDEIQRIAAEREKGRHLETLGRMASGVAHDFNNVLTGIRLSAELARLKVPPGQNTEELEAIQLAVARGGELVKSLLLFARGETAAAQRLDLNALVREMQPVLGKLMSDRYRVRLELDPAAMEILGDRTGVARILSNLVVNARDAMPDGGEILVATMAVPPKEGSAKRAGVLRVSDTGAGISPEVLPRIFEPFYTTKGEGKGTGLGLTIVQTFVQKMGGEISVESKPGRGTTFEVRLPLAA